MPTSNSQFVFISNGQNQKDDLYIEKIELFLYVISRADVIIIIDEICIAPFTGPKAALHGEQTNKQRGQIIK